MDTMIEEPVTEPVPEVIPEPVVVAEVVAKPTPKKRGRKPKMPLPPPAPPAPPAEAQKPRKRRVIAAKLSKGEKAIAAAISAAQIERVKSIDECAKMMVLQGSKMKTLEAVEWKIAMLSGAPIPSQAPASGPGYPLPPQYPQPPAYPTNGVPRYIPPSMREPTLPAIPMAGGGAVDTGIEQEEDDPDKFLKADGVLGGKGWA